MFSCLLSLISRPSFESISKKAFIDLYLSIHYIHMVRLKLQIKVFADVVESTVGAVFIDYNYSIDTTWEVRDLKRTSDEECSDWEKLSTSLKVIILHPFYFFSSHKMRSTLQQKLIKCVLSGRHAYKSTYMSKKRSLHGVVVAGMLMDFWENYSY